MAYALVVDLTKCFGCMACTLACKDEFVGNDWPPYSLAQPDSGQQWLKVTYLERGTQPKIKLAWTPTPCMQCDNAPCMKAATGGAVYKRGDGIVVIDPVASVGQKQIVSACPYGAIYWNSTLNIPQKCTFCVHLLDSNSPYGATALSDAGLSAPRCVQECGTTALTFGNIADLQPLISSTGATPLHPEYGTAPRVYYIGLPKRFITGAVIDGATKECVAGAQVKAVDLAGGAQYTTTSDSYGDFWFEGLELNKTYNVTVSASGKLTKTLVAFTGTDVNLGDITVF
jgi:Fe-S-cluster-containing dehydrogenase component